MKPKIVAPIWNIYWHEPYVRAIRIRHQIVSQPCTSPLYLSVVSSTKANNK